MFLAAVMLSGTPDEMHYLHWKVQVSPNIPYAHFSALWTHLRARWHFCREHVVFLTHLSFVCRRVRFRVQGYNHMLLRIVPNNHILTPILY